MDGFLAWLQDFGSLFGQLAEGFGTTVLIFLLTLVFALPLGMPLAFGGPYLGFMAATAAMARKLPGRIVGETKDDKGERAFVLTLQAREQHIRREKASSNVCSNQAWCALTASVYMTAMGADGMAEAAAQCMSKAHYLRDVLKEAGLEPKHDREFFHEFVTVSP